MEEPKKISFSTLGPVKTNVKKVKRRKTVRITINLPESNEKSCPEYNYGELYSQYMVSLLHLLSSQSLSSIIVIYILYITLVILFWTQFLLSFLALFAIESFPIFHTVS